jgi:hypothetical protein
LLALPEVDEVAFWTEPARDGRVDVSFEITTTR